MENGKLMGDGFFVENFQLQLKEAGVKDRPSVSLIHHK